jgi:hypothetical protein
LIGRNNQCQKKHNVPNSPPILHSGRLPTPAAAGSDIDCDTKIDIINS